MTKNYELSFTTRDDIYIENAVSKISEDGEKSVITAELFNKTSAAINYSVIGVIRNADGKILSIKAGTSGALAAGDVCDISVETAKNAEAKYFDLYIWDGISSMKPLIKKSTFNSVNERTYGYDNYADSEKTVRIAFIGGSITQQGQYTSQLKTSLASYLKSENKNREVKFVNTAVDGGVGGTGSDLGLYRLEKDVISQNPDIVFIEFAVNDASNENRVKTMEGIIRKLMKLDHQPIVILLNVTTSTYGSFESIEDWQDLMTAYGVGSVNVAQYLKDNIATEDNSDGKFVWKASDKETYPNATVLTGDGVHPNADGGKIYAEYMYNTLTQDPKNFFKKMNYVQTPVSGFEYNNTRMVSWKEAEYDINWKSTEEMNWAFADGVASAAKEGATLTFKFTGTTIGLYAPKSQNGGTASYSIDGGEKTGTVSINSGTTSKMEMMSLIANDLEEGEHTITITVNSLNGKYFNFGYFIVD